MVRTLAIALVLPFALGACSGRSDPPAEHTQANGWNDPGLRLAICGVVGDYRSPGPDGDGRLALDVGTWVIARDAHLGGAELLEPDAAVCLGATLDTERRITAGDVSPAPAEDPWARLPP